VLQMLAPAGVGNIDESVSRRLALKIRALENLLDDPDLNDLAGFEEGDDDWEDNLVDVDDIRDMLLAMEGRRLPPSLEVFDSEAISDA